MKLKEIRSINAHDITTVKIPEGLDLEKIAISYGIYGMNGGLFQDRKTGERYKIIARSTNLFRLA